MEKSLSLNEIRSRCAQFVVEWRDAAGDERQEDQSFVRDLLMAFGISETKSTLYQKRVQRSSTGNQGYIDALVPGLLLIEMKSSGKPLALAEAQALDYIHHLPEAEVPRYVLTSDFKKFRLLDLKSPAGKDITEFDLEQLPSKAESLAFLAGYEIRSFGNVDQQEASIKAAKLMGDLYEALEGAGYSEHESSIFLVRTLFALYADDAGLWQRDTFTDFINLRTSDDGSDLGAQLSMLFQVLNQPLESRLSNLDEFLQRFPYVNGGVFGEPLSIPSFDSKMRNTLLKACAFDWSSISPAIFGSLFQAVKSAEARRELGEHYTTETNIRKVIDPLFLDDLKSRFENAKNDAVALREFRSHLGKLRILDPACGCGNFLVVTYRELRNLELITLKRLQELGDKDSIPTLFFDRSNLFVRLEHIYGIEIEEWPARIAQTALLLTEHQANKQMELTLGKAPNILPLEKISGIHIANALRTDWSEVAQPSAEMLVIGNPPFVGKKEKQDEQKEDLQLVWGEKYDGYFDYVTGWFKKAADYLDGFKGAKFAFVATNSISQGQPVASLYQPLFQAGWEIKFAHQSFAWSSEAPGMAHVHCVIVGLSKVKTESARLFSYAKTSGEPVEHEVNSINAYLLDAPNLFVRKRSDILSPELGPINSGSIAIDWGYLTLDASPFADVIKEVQNDEIAKKYLRRYVGGDELINSKERWCLWLEDATAKDISSSAVLKAQVSAVAELRGKATRLGTKKVASTPHLFGENRQPKVDYLGIPQTFSENRFWATADRLSKDVIANTKLFTVEDPDGFAFAIVSSSMFIVWQKAIGGRLEMRLSFSNTVVWNNLPLPKVDAKLREQIIEAGKKIIEVRKKYPDLSLAELYNPLGMKLDLVRAHEALDKVVDKAFGASQALSSNVEREQLLFATYTAMTS